MHLEKGKRKKLIFLKSQENDLMKEKKHKKKEENVRQIRPEREGE